MKAAYCTLALLIPLVLFGCGGPDGPQRGDARGAVTFQGEPVTEGTVTLFNPTGGYEVAAPLREDGTFVIETKEGGTIVGEYVVTVRPLMVGDNSEPGTPGVLVEKDVPNIPAKYRQSHTSPIKVTIQPGANDLKVEMAP